MTSFYSKYFTYLKLTLSVLPEIKSSVCDYFYTQGVLIMLESNLTIKKYFLLFRCVDIDHKDHGQFLHIKNSKPTDFDNLFFNLSTLIVHFYQSAALLFFCSKFRYLLNIWRRGHLWKFDIWKILRTFVFPQYKGCKYQFVLKVEPC